MASQLPSFDVLMDLAQNNPEQLEDLRKTFTDEIIRDASPRIRHKLEGINFKVNMERQRSKTPLQSCIRIAALMHDSFNQMREGLDILLQPPAPLHSVDRQPSVANEMFCPPQTEMSRPFAEREPHAKSASSNAPLNAAPDGLLENRLHGKTSEMKASNVIPFNRGPRLISTQKAD